MDMYMGDALSRRFTIGLHDIDAIGLEGILEAVGHRLRRKHDLSDLIVGQVRELLDVAARHNHAVPKYCGFSRKEYDHSVVTSDLTNFGISAVDDGTEWAVLF